MITNMGAIIDIFNDQYFKGNKCIHEKKVLRDLGLTCKIFYKLYENKFNPKIKYYDAWEIFYRWIPTPFYYDVGIRKGKYVVDVVNCDFNVSHMGALSMTCKALNNIFGFGNCTEQCGKVCWKNNKEKFKFIAIINKNKFEHKMKEKYENVNVINNIYRNNYNMRDIYLPYNLYGSSSPFLQYSDKLNPKNSINKCWRTFRHKNNYLPNLKSLTLTINNVKHKDIKTLVTHNYITEKQSIDIYKQFDSEMKYKVAQHKKNKIFDVSLEIQNKNRHNKNNNKIFNTKRAYNKPVYQPMKK